jgi:16S rRNA (cytosine967-C5)-methyltransferase
MTTARPPHTRTARAAAFAVVRRVFERGAYADRALAAEAAVLDDRDRALATRIAYGTVPSSW